MSTTTTKSARKSSAKSTKSTGRKTGAKTTGRKSQPVKSSAPAASARPSVTSTTTSAYTTADARLKAAKPGTLLVRRFGEHSEAAQLATKRFQTTASRPGADPTKQSGVTTANIADIAAAIKQRKTTAEKLLGVPAADVIAYAEKGTLTKRAEAAELPKTLRDFSIAVFGSGTRNKLRGKRIAAAFSVLMDGGMKTTPARAAAKSSAKRSAVKSTKRSGRKS